MKQSRPFRSLRLRLLAPIIATALVAAGVVALVSNELASRWISDELEARFLGIEQTLSDSRFPLNQVVLQSLAELTQTEFITLDREGQPQQSTLEGTIPDQRPAGESITIEGRRFFARSFSTVGAETRPDSVFEVIVLFDRIQIEADRKRAAVLPLVTGLSTILAISTVTLLLTSRLVRRIGRLQQRVEQVADGDFHSVVSDAGGDEIGRLGNAVDSMARQLSVLWQKVNRQQGEKLLHQVAGGMAHQLRNSLTGARMAVELHAADCPSRDDEGLRIAIDQIESAEDYVRRLLLVASGRQDEDRPMAGLVCLHDLQSSLSPIAKHLRIELTWNFDEAIADHSIRDGPTWVAAITNMIQNAMQAGDKVRVDARLIDQQIRVTVSDNGPGIPETMIDDVFEPFVTTKPEGMGLGLAVVRRAAESFGGAVNWKRTGQQTEFELTVPTLTIDKTQQ
ncbi:Sporulation kinase D [Planctomycetes bacterium CA13]|uniref:histidine kinase n=1 Tax=Novipirellula herctigrandis TaxID=2527986 RepID=A0A5C5Z4Z1_9BACT|nr:Sporulation kinase D [Planctomycetes bacterium CA13]